MEGKPLDKSNENVSGIHNIWKLISRKAPQLLFELLEIVYNITAIYRVAKIIRQEPVDMIYERNAYYLFAGSLISVFFGIPLVVEANEVVGVKSARKLRLITIAKAVERYVFKHAQAIYTVSSYLKKKIDIITKDDSRIYIYSQCY